MKRTRADTIARIALGIGIGMAVGIGGYTFIYGKGASYLTNDPAACANCHIMQRHFEAWSRSSHRSVAVCNDCHTPDGFLAKYAAKASNGFWHSFAFTSGNFAEPLQIKESNKRIAESACRGCHRELVESIDGIHGDDRSLTCVRCHDSVGHLE